MPRLLTRTSPLTAIERAAWFRAHLPYLRVALTNHIRLSKNQALFGSMPMPEQHRVRICTYEVGVLTCRKFIEFFGLGITYKPTYKLIEARGYVTAKEDGNSYEVKIVDLGGRWVELAQLTDIEKDLLAKIYLTGHRATVHLTDSSPYQGEWEIFDDAVTLVDRLLKLNLFDVVGEEARLQ